METLICAACGLPIENSGKIKDKVVTWENKRVHLVCPTYKINVLTGNSYHTHIFWNEVVPGGVYTYDPTLSWEEVVASAAGYGITVSREDLGGGPVNEYEFVVVEVSNPPAPA